MITWSNRKELSTRRILFELAFRKPVHVLRSAPLAATFFLALASGFCITRPAAAAVIAFIPSGSHATPDSIALPTGLPNYSMTDPTVIADTFTASLKSEIFVGSSVNPYANGTLGSNPLAETFVYQVQNSSFSDDGITTFSVQSFAGSAASVSYNATGDQFIPGSAERSGATTADAIAFYFVPPIGVPGASAYMIVNTDATSYYPVSATLQDGSNVAAASFAVYAPQDFIAPEPASVVIMALGLIGVLAFARGRRQAHG